MEPTMISPKVLSTAAAIALVLPMMVPSASFAQHPNGRANFAVRGGGGGPPAARFSGGGGAPVARFSGVSGGPPVARFNGGGGGAPVTRFSSGGGGAWQGGYGHRYRRGGGGFFPGVVAGAVIGGALASESYAYYGGPGYYAPGYYDDGYYDDGGAVAVAPAPVGDDTVAYCMQTYQSYDPASGTYLGYDGLRHPCP
jgi:BA14K-like protein